MPLSYRQAGNLFVAGPNISIYPSGNSFAISGASTGTTTGITNISTIGVGQFTIASSITNNSLIYRTLSATSGFGIIESANGTLIFTAASSVSGTIISGVNVGTGVGIFTGLTTINNPNDSLAFYTLSGTDQGSVFINDSGEIIISRGRTVVNTLSNQGGGARLYSGITGNSVVSRTIPASASGFSPSLSPGVIAIPTSSTDSDATAFITAASITDSRQIAAIQNLVSDLKINGLWNKMLAIYPFVGGTADTHKWNLKDPRDLNAAYRLDFGTSNVIHDSNGIRTDAGNSTLQPTINTFIQLNLVSALTDNIHVSFYNRINFLYAAGAAAGGNVGNTASNVAFLSYPRGGGAPGQWQVNIGSSTSAYPTVADNSLGFYIASRTSSTGNTFYKNGFLSAMTSNTVHLSSITGSILLLRYANNPENTGQYAFFSFGSGLTNSESLAYTTIVENYQTTLSRQVITLQNQIVRIIPTNATADRFYINSSTGTLDVPAPATLSPLAASATMGIGATPVATTRLLIGAGTAAISQLRLTPFPTEPTNPSDGDVWFTTSGNTLKFEKGTIATDFIFKDDNNVFKDNNNIFSGYSPILIVDSAGTINTKYVNLFGLFNTLSSVTVASTAAETSIISSVLTGSTTLLASTNVNNPELVVGKKFRFNAKGTIQTDNSNVDTLEVKIKLGSTTIGTTSAYTVHKNIPANTYFEIDATFTIRNSNIIVCNGKIFGSENIRTSPNINIRGIYNQNATVTTTSNQIFDCTVKFDQANANNTITINESTLEFLN